jgi:hypothetical protein
MLILILIDSELVQNHKPVRISAAADKHMQKLNL